MLMAMDDKSFAARWKRTLKPKDILAELAIAHISDYFIVEPEGVLPASAPVDWSKPEYDEVKVEWRSDLTALDRRRLEAQLLPFGSYKERVIQANRPEQVLDTIHDHIWDTVNDHLGTYATSMPQLIEQLGVMRFGHRPLVADTFCGSGQIPFEAARLGCDTYASDLSPIACMLTWGALHIIGGPPERVEELQLQQQDVVNKVLTEIDKLGIETDGNGWRAKAYLYCLEVVCPQSGWKVPLLPSRILSYSKRSIVELVPDAKQKRYQLIVHSGVSQKQIKEAAKGTLQSDGRGQEPYLVHKVEGMEYRTKISTLRGDYGRKDGVTDNKLRLWEKDDFKPRPDDIFQERLYAVHWMKPKEKGRGYEYEFRTVTDDDLKRENVVEAYIATHLADWQDNGWLPDMRIESGEKTDEPVRTRGWSYWHHLFPPRHLLLLGLLRKLGHDGHKLILLSRVLNYTSKLCIWSTSKPGKGKPGSGGRTGGASDNPVNVFYNQALNSTFR
jgi:putative DNA methylase